jgi:hypothetical protein
MLMHDTYDLLTKIHDCAPNFSKRLADKVVMNHVLISRLSSCTFYAFAAGSFSFSASSVR